MASTGLQLVGFILGVASWVGMIATCASPEWRKNSHGQTIIDNTLRYDGLWVRCKEYVTGETNCADYQTFFIGLPGVLQVCRALMIASIGIGFIAILITILGIKCTSIGSANHRVKAWVAVIGGLLFGVAGNLILVVVIHAYQWALNEGYTVTKAFYLCIAIGVVGNVAGLALVFGSCPYSCFSNTDLDKFDHAKSATIYSMTDKRTDVPQVQILPAYRKKRDEFLGFEEPTTIIEYI